MKKRHMPDMKEGGVNVTPLIDIVMVLIIFFMLVAKIGVSRGIDNNISLPSSIVGRNLDSLSNTLTINVHFNRSSEEPLINTMIDGVRTQLHVTKYASSADLDISRFLKAFSEARGEKVNVIIRGDRDLPYSQLEMVLLSASVAKIPNISYETKSGADDTTATGSGGV